MATPKFYVKASSYSNINPYPTWKRDADYWEKDISNNQFYMAGNIGIGYPIPAGGLVVTTTIGIGTSTPQEININSQVVSDPSAVNRIVGPDGITYDAFTNACRRKCVEIILNSYQVPNQPSIQSLLIIVKGECFS